MLIRFVAISLILYCSIFIAPAVAQNKVWTLVPAESCGDFRIGQGYDEIEKALGKAPDKVKAVQNGYLARFDTRGIVVQYHSFTRKVQFIGVNREGAGGASYKTGEGVAVGSSRSTVEQKYGPSGKIVPVTSHDFYPKSEVLAIYAEKGIGFHYDSNDIVVVIIVFDPALYGY